MSTPLSICFIGNSHLTTIKQTYSKFSSQFTDIIPQYLFFPGRGAGFTLEKVDNRDAIVLSERWAEKLKTIQGADLCKFIFLDEVDLFVIHGISCPFRSLANAFLDANEPLDDKDLNLAPPLSKEDIARRIHSLPMVRILESLTRLDKRVLLSPAPFFNETVVLADNEERNYHRVKKLVNSRGEPIPAALELLRESERLLRRYNILKQPAQTITNTIFSNKEYMLSEAHKGGRLDYVHGNHFYGKVVLEALREWCRDNHIVPGTEAVAKPDQARTDRSDAALHPYNAMPDKSFWLKAVGNKSGVEIENWYEKKFNITNMKIATAGSCFAQHIGRRMQQRGFDYIDVEPAPLDLPIEQHRENGYGLFSARYGNIYTPRQLLQLFDRAMGDFTPKESHWETEGGFVDPFRPNIQPVPFSTIDELVQARDAHLKSVKEMFEQVTVFVFTFGLTETWASKEDGAVFPLAPGVAGGKFDDDKYEFLNLGLNQTLKDVKSFISKVRAINNGVRFIFTVSPVPLMATATAENVILATSYSKSVLRAVAGQLASSRNHIDYFPSYEIISSHVMQGQFYEADMRSVTEAGVDHVMNIFFSEHKPPLGEPPKAFTDFNDADADEIICDEILIAALSEGT